MLYEQVLKSRLVQVFNGWGGEGGRIALREIDRERKTRFVVIFNL